MRTVTFKSVLWGLALRLGLDPAENLQTNQAQALVEYINARVREAWEWADWPELVAVEERAFAVAHDSSLTYNTGNLVWDAGTASYYTALSAVPGGIQISNATYWEATATADVTKNLPRAQTGQTEIGDLFNVYTRDPHANANPGELDWWPIGNNYQVQTNRATVWIYYRTVPSHFTEVPYSASRAYTTGETVYDPTTGECYRAAQGSTGQAVTNTTYWTKLDMPRVLSEAVKCGAYADSLREAGQSSRAGDEEGRYEAMLISEIDKVTAQAGRWPRWKAQVTG